MAKQIKKIETLNELQKLVPRLIEEHGKNKQLMKAALSNPILALEEIGYILSPKVKQEVEERARFNSEQQKKRIEITEKVNKIVGKKIDLSSKTSVTNALKYAFPKKTISVGKKTIETNAIIKAATTTRELQIFQSLWQASQNKVKKDPLSEFKATHELVPLLLEYRKIEALSPQFATKKTFTSVLKDKDAKKGVSISNVRFRLQERSKRKTAK